MSRITRIFPFPVTVLTTTLLGQPGAMGAGQAGPDAAFDISSYWTSPMHEDALECGPGPETADYEGFPITEEARLFALSYNVSRVTLRQHQCDGYVTAYQVRAAERSPGRRESPIHRG